MKYVAKFYTTEKDILKRFGFDPEVSVVKSVNYNQETGDIEVLIRSVKMNESTSEVEDSGLVRRKKF